MIECLALIAAICLNQTAEVELRRDGSGTGAYIKLRDGEIISEIASDVLISPDRKLMHKVCRSECLYHAQNCSENSSGSTCIIYYLNTGDVYLKRIELSAKSAKDIQSIKRSVDICLSTGCLRLSDLSNEIKGHFPPFERR